VSRKGSSGDGDDYTTTDVDSLVDAMEAQYQALDAIGDGRATMRVTAQVEWAGTVQNNGRNGVRTTNLRLDAGGAARIKRAVDRARTSAAPGSSYKARSSPAQLRELERTRKGRGILTELGFRPSRETRRRWSLPESNPLSQRPGKANRDRIGQAYGQLRDTARPGTTGASRAARRAVADTVTSVLAEGEGMSGFAIRLRDISHIEWPRT
jgi:hypothetical protein